MKFQVSILLLAAIVGYANAAALDASSTSTLALKTTADAAVPAAGLTEGDDLRMICTTNADSAIATIEFTRAGTIIKTMTATTATTQSHTYDHTLVAADVGDATSYKCQYKGASLSALESGAQTAKVLAKTTTAAPTTTTKAGGSGNGAGSNSPVMAVFLLSIAAMCF